MFMTATRLMIDGKPVLKLNIHEFNDDDIAFLDSLGIDQLEDASPHLRYTHIHNQEAFLNTRAAILERYNILKETGPKVFLEAK